MGLDTGIVCVVTDEVKFGEIPQEIISICEKPFHINTDKEHEFHYWRKKLYS